MGVGPIEAVRKALGQAAMTIEDVDVMELNEAFAAQVLPVCRELGDRPVRRQARTRTAARSRSGIRTA